MTMARDVGFGTGTKHQQVTGQFSPEGEAQKKCLPTVFLLPSEALMFLPLCLLATTAIHQVASILTISSLERPRTILKT